MAEGLLFVHHLMLNIFDGLPGFLIKKTGPPESSSKATGLFPKTYPHVPVSTVLTLAINYDFVIIVLLIISTKKDVNRYFYSN